MHFEFFWNVQKRPRPDVDVHVHIYLFVLCLFRFFFHSRRPHCYYCIHVLYHCVSSVFIYYSTYILFYHFISFISTKIFKSIIDFCSGFKLFNRPPTNPFDDTMETKQWSEMALMILSKMKNRKNKKEETKKQLNLT